MKRVIAFGLLAVFVAVVGCQSDRSNQGASATGGARAESTQTSAADTLFTAALTGADMMPPVMTEATGEARLAVEKMETEIVYTLTVTNVTDAIMAHIHECTADSLGPIEVWLYPPSPGQELKAGSFTGTLAEGTIVADSLVGPMQGKTVADLVNQMRAGNACIVVHTQAHPDGEILGKIHSAQAM